MNTRTVSEILESLRIEGWTSCCGPWVFVSKDMKWAKVVFPDGSTAEGPIEKPEEGKKP